MSRGQQDIANKNWTWVVHTDQQVPGEQLKLMEMHNVVLLCANMAGDLRHLAINPSSNRHQGKTGT